MPLDAVLSQARLAARAGCKEALFTLGDKPELRYKAARDGLAELGHESTLSYLREAAERVLVETGLLPHLNPGLMTAEDIEGLRPVAPSMGIMLESVSMRLHEKGQAHYGCPDKVPRRRLETLRLAGEARVPFTSGILIGIGETREERIDALLALRDLHDEHRPHPGSHRPELPRQAGDPDGRRARADARGPAVDDRGGPAGARPGDAHPGAAQPEPRRAAAARGRRHRRLGRRVAGDARLRQPRGALAPPGTARGRDGRRRQDAGRAADRVPQVGARRRALARRRPRPEPGDQAVGRRPRGRAATDRRHRPASYRRVVPGRTDPRRRPTCWPRSQPPPPRTATARGHALRRASAPFSTAPWLARTSPRARSPACSRRGDRSSPPSAPRRTRSGAK